VARSGESRYSSLDTLPKKRGVSRG